nr:MAG TPA: hypothetical protein [Caudoviricetes sp.]
MHRVGSGIEKGTRLLVAIVFAKKVSPFCNNAHVRL